MYTQQEASAIRQEFWTTMGKYLSPIPSASGNKINWINYKTGVKNILYKMDADKHEAIARIEIRGETEKRTMLYTIFSSLKNTADTPSLSGWDWQPETIDEHGKIIGCICAVKKGVNIFKKDDWPVLISFFKEKKYCI